MLQHALGAVAGAHQGARHHLEKALGQRHLAVGGACAHLETETYTLEVLPDGMRTSPVECAARELQWVRARMAPQP